jgi:hypothetical protein
MHNFRFVFFLLCQPLLLLGGIYHKYNSNIVSPSVVPYFENQSDVALISRIMKSYIEMAQLDLARGKSQWNHIFQKFHAPIHDAFLKKDFDEIAAILRYPHKSYLFYGIDGLDKDLRYQSTSIRKAQARAAFDLLVRFSESLGCTRKYNPEQPLNHLETWRADEMLDRIEAFLGIQLEFPNPYPYEVGFSSSRGVVSYRAMQALYQAWKIADLLKNIENPKVLELGAGLGRVGFFLNLFGIHDYTIVDLPMTIVSSSYFLGRTLGDAAIALPGEFPNNAKVRFLTPEQFLSLNDSYDLILNADSLPEMDPVIAKRYISKILSLSPIFLSINQESQVNVRNIVLQENIPLFSSRSLYWLRDGYLEEIFFKK